MHRSAWRGPCWRSPCAVAMVMPRAFSSGALSISSKATALLLPVSASTCRQAARAERKVVVFAHHPIFPTGNHNEWNADALLRVVERNRNVVAWINGHNHAGAFGVHEGVPFITLKGMVETEKTNAFAVLHLHPDRLELVGHGREPSRELAFRES